MCESSDSEPFQDSGSEYLPESTSNESDSLSNASEQDDLDVEPITMSGNFTVVPDPFAVSFTSFEF